MEIMFYYFSKYSGFINYIRKNKVIFSIEGFIIKFIVGGVFVFLLRKHLWKNSEKQYMEYLQNDNKNKILNH